MQNEASNVDPINQIKCTCEHHPEDGNKTHIREQSRRFIGDEFSVDKIKVADHMHSNREFAHVDNCDTKKRKNVLSMNDQFDFSPDNNLNHAYSMASSPRVNLNQYLNDLDTY
jgi:hypothetical protein